MTFCMAIVHYGIKWRVDHIGQVFITTFTTLTSRPKKDVFKQCLENSNIVFWVFSVSVVKVALHVVVGLKCSHKQMENQNIVTYLRRGRGREVLLLWWRYAD